MKSNFYEQFGISETASISEIKVAYRKLAFLYHPDKTGGDKVAEEKLKVINSIYEILTNEIKRKEYDRYLIRERINHNQGNAYASSDRTNYTEDTTKGQQFRKGGNRRTSTNSSPRVKNNSIFKIYWFIIFIVVGIIFNYVSSDKIEENNTDNLTTSNKEVISQPKTGEVEFGNTNSYQYQVQDSNRFVRQPKEKKSIYKKRSSNTKVSTGNIKF